MASSLAPSLQGELFVYTTAPLVLSAFITGPRDATTCLVLLGGMTDGLLFANWAGPLASVLADRCRTATVFPVLASSYTRFGTSSLEEDCDLLDQLVRAIQARFPSMTSFVLMGHSTGAQVTVKHASVGKSAPLFAGRILHAPVADGDFLKDTMADWATVKTRCSLNDPESIMPAYYPGTDPLKVPITNSRMLSLMTGAEGWMFSSRISDESMRQMCSCMDTAPTLLILPECDEYVTDDAKAALMAPRFVRTMGGPDLVTAAIIPGAGHACSEHTPDVVQIVVDWLTRITTK